ncbi:MAG: hydrogenase subunit MbhD domain-containing protein, partial [Nitriliruptoraceae bacterium]
MPQLLFDVILVISLTGSAAATVFAADPVRASLLFVVFGLLSALAWVRLAAPDIALAEAAVGAGLTGVLLLDAAREARTPEGRTPPRSSLLAVAVPVLALVGVLIAAVLSVPRTAEGLGPAVTQALPDTGVVHGVTAVLLAFRAFDTWLEVAVLLVAVAVVLALQHAQHFRV